MVKMVARLSIGLGWNFNDRTPYWRPTSVVAFYNTPEETVTELHSNPHATGDKNK